MKFVRAVAHICHHCKMLVLQTLGSVYALMFVVGLLLLLFVWYWNLPPAILFVPLKK